MLPPCPARGWAQGEAPETSLFCRSTTRCRSLATWSPWGGECWDILVAACSVGGIWGLHSSGEMKGGAARFSFVFPNPLRRGLGRRGTRQFPVVGVWRVMSGCCELQGLPGELA